MARKKIDWVDFGPEDLGPFITNVGAAALVINHHPRTLDGWLEKGRAPKQEVDRLRSLARMFIAPIDECPDRIELSIPMQHSVRALREGELAVAEGLASYTLQAAVAGDANRTHPMLNLDTGERLAPSALDVFMARWVKSVAWVRWSGEHTTERGHAEAEALYLDLRRYALTMVSERPAHPHAHHPFVELELVECPPGMRKAATPQYRIWDYLVKSVVARYLVACTV